MHCLIVQVNNDSSCTNDECEDEEIDAAEIEEEEWKEYTKTSTIEAMEKMENEKIRCWNMTQGKIDMETDDENRNIIEREMIDGRYWMKPRTQLKIQTNRSIDRRKKDGKTTSTNLTIKLGTRLEIWLKAASISRKFGSKQQETAEDGLYSKISVTRTRRNFHNRPARYVNGVKLSDEQVVDIT